MNAKVMRALTACIAATGVVACADRRIPMEVVIWHTELDADAERVVREIARGVEQTYRDSFAGVVPLLTVSALDWGDVATRLFQELDHPPDVTHLEPFMVNQVYHTFAQPDGFALYPLDSLIEGWSSARRQLDPALAALHRYPRHASDDSATFGIAYAVGTTYLTYRRDWLPARSRVPDSWEALIPFAEALAREGTRLTGREVAPFVLPGRSPFFIDQLFNEIVVSLGGSLYDGQGRPNLRTPEATRTLSIMQDMIARTAGLYPTTSYLQQFDLYSQGRGAVVPVTYGRATKRIEAELTRSGSNDSVHRAAFAVMPQLGPVPGRLGSASIDAEPWVVIARPPTDPNRAARLKVAMAFLDRFFEPANYLRFCGTVPVHLRPVFREMWPAFDSLPPQQRWRHWVASGRRMLETPGGVAPILMDRLGSRRPHPSFALSLQRTSVLSDLVLEATPREILDAIVRGNRSESAQLASQRRVAIERALARAQARAEELFEQSRPPAP